MDNEATLEKIGDSIKNGPTAADDSAAHDEHETDAATECSNGACMLNWKPARNAA